MSVEYRTYVSANCAVFWKTKDEFGGFSNMAGGYPLLINDVKISTAEALYQACKFPHNIELQKKIIGQRSPIFAKKVCKPYDHEVRKDWMEIRVNVMRWVLKVKLIQNWKRFSNDLLNTGNRSIVEFSEKDDFWGAKEGINGELYGRNVLGRLLMELRQNVINNPAKETWILTVPDIENFTLLEQLIIAPPHSNGEYGNFFDLED